MGDRSAVVNLFYRRLRQVRHVHLKWSGEGVMFGGNDDFLKIASCGGYQPFLCTERSCLLLGHASVGGYSSGGTDRFLCPSLSP